MKSAGFRVLKAPDVPSVLIELGYVTHKDDLKLITSDQWRGRTADAIRADRFLEAGATTVQEIGYALAEGADRLAAAIASGRTPDEAAGALTFVFAVGSSYFLEIAKLRAARLCWAQVAGAFGAGRDDAARMRLIVRTARANKSTYDPYTNLLRVTTEAMSAACG